MPTYTVFAPAGRLSAAHKQQLARAITEAHNRHTGASTFFAQVMFRELPAGDWYIGGAPIEGEQIFLHGQLRAGRTPEVKHALLAELSEVLGGIPGIARNRVWAYLIDLVPEQLVEYGHFLPQPGGEAAWMAALPAADRDYMQRVGR